MRSPVSATDIPHSEDSPRLPGPDGRAGFERSGSADLGATVVFTTTLVLAGVGLLMAAVMLVADPEPVAGGFASTRQGAETALYLAAFGIALPVGLYAGPKLTRWITEGPNAEAMSGLAALLACGLAAVVVLLRLSDVFAWGGGFGALLAGVTVWWIAAAAIIVRAARTRPWPALLRVVRSAQRIWAAAALLGLGAVLTVAHFPSVSPVPLVAGALGVAVVLYLFASGRSLPWTGRRWRIAADALMAGVLLLAIPDLVIVMPEAPAPGFAERFTDLTIQFHQDFLLGPANQLLGGGTMLVDTSSQYGVGSIDFVAGWFVLLPIGYGTLGLLDGALTGLYFLAGFLTLRLCAVSRLLSGSALVVAVIGLVYNREYPVGSIVQEGPLRFGLPLILILAVVAAERWPGRRTVLRAVALAVLGLSSIWAMEMLAYTAATLAVLLATEAYLLPRGRMRWLARQAALALAFCVAAHLLFAAGTLLGSGELPEWGQYLVYLRAFVLGDVGDITYDFARWSPGLAVGAGYLASAVALGLALRLKPRPFENDRVTLLALAGTTGYGIAFLSYFVDRSAPHVLVYVCLPLLLSGTLWLSTLVAQRRSGPSRAAVGALAFSLCLALILLTGAWPRLGPRFEQSALAHAVPGVKSARAAFDRLEDFPRFDPRSLAGERLLARFMPEERSSLVLVKPGLDIELLMHSGRSNALPLPNAIQYSFVGSDKLPALRETVAELEPGRRMLLDQAQLVGLALFKRSPGSIGPLTQVPPIGTPTTPLQVRTLAEIDRRFRLRPVHNGGGFVVVQLEARR